MGRVERTGKVLEMAKAVFMLEGSTDYARSGIIDSGTHALEKSLERTRWYRVGDSVAPEGLDCKGIDAASTLTTRVFSTLRETYNIPSSVGLLRPAPEDRPSHPRNGFAAITIRSLVCGLHLPILPIVQRILA